AVAGGGLSPYTYSVLLGNGDGSFRTVGTYPAATYYAKDVELADLSGDGRLDLVTTLHGSGAGQFGNGDGTFRAATPYPLHAGRRSATVADLNNDGHLDVAVADDGGPGADPATVSVFLNSGNGTLGTRADYSIGSTYANAVNVAVGDLNNDGFLDLAVS